MLAAARFWNRSGSFIPIPAQAMTPIPPALATAEASPDSATPTPNPPCNDGQRRGRLPDAERWGPTIHGGHPIVGRSVCAAASGCRPGDAETTTAVAARADDRGLLRRS